MHKYTRNCFLSHNPVKKNTMRNFAYKLYALSYKEVLVIDPDFSVTAAEYAAVEVGE
jgi:hypothetical protein